MESEEARSIRFLAGDHKALVELIGTYKECLTLFIYGCIKDQAEAENLMIDVFVQLVVSRGRFKGKSSLKTYLFAIGRNEALRYLKKNKRTDRLRKFRTSNCGTTRKPTISSCVLRWCRPLQGLEELAYGERIFQTYGGGSVHGE